MQNADGQYIADVVQLWMPSRSNTVYRSHIRSELEKYLRCKVQNENVYLFFSGQEITGLITDNAPVELCLQSSTPIRLQPIIEPFFQIYHPNPSIYMESDVLVVKYNYNENEIYVRISNNWNSLCKSMLTLQYLVSTSLPLEFVLRAFRILIPSDILDDFQLHSICIYFLLSKNYLNLQQIRSDWIPSQIPDRPVSHSMYGSINTTLFSIILDISMFYTSNTPAVSLTNVKQPDRSLLSIQDPFDGNITVLQPQVYGRFQSLMSNISQKMNGRLISEVLRPPHQSGYPYVLQRHMTSSVQPIYNINPPQEIIFNPSYSRASSNTIYVHPPNELPCLPVSHSQYQPPNADDQLASPSSTYGNSQTSSESSVRVCYDFPAALPNSYHRREVSEFGTPVLKLLEGVEIRYYPNGTEECVISMEDDDDNSLNADLDRPCITNGVEVTMWLNPKPTMPIIVKNCYDDPVEYIDTIKNNLLAEYYKTFQDVMEIDGQKRKCCVKDPRFIALVDESSPTHTQLICRSTDKAVNDGIYCYLVGVISQLHNDVLCSLHLVTKQENTQSETETENRVLNTIEVYPAIPNPDLSHVVIHPLEYIGSFITQYDAIISAISYPLIKTVANPNLRHESDWNISTNIDNIVKRRILRNLRWNLEVVQGPPGTGKSHLIHHIRKDIKDSKVFITAQNNAAIDALADLIEDKNSVDIIVCGNNKKLTSRLNFSVQEVAKRYPEYVRCNRNLNRTRCIYLLVKTSIVIKAIQNLNIMVGRRQLQINRIRLFNELGLGSISEVARTLSLPKLIVYLYLRNIDTTSMAQIHILSYISEVRRRKIRVLKELHGELMVTAISNAKCFMCTLSSIKRFSNLYRRLTSEPLNISTLIVDEAGCVSELSVPLAIALEPENFLIIGDHKQLPPYSKLNSKYRRSFMERIVDNIGSPMMMTTNYRMHEDICALVSRMFYDGQLRTAEDIRAARLETSPIIWINVDDKEKKAGKSFYNTGELDEITKVVKWLTEKRPRYKVLATSFYESQTTKLKKTLKDVENVSVLTVDASQGQQSDVVIVSCVRNNEENGIGFTDSRNRICVALSRSKQMLIIVGSESNMKINKDWSTVIKYSKKYKGGRVSLSEWLDQQNPSLQ